MECIGDFSFLGNKLYGSLLRDLDGVVESGFVKCYLRKFEEGVFFVLFVMLFDDVGFVV